MSIHLELKYLILVKNTSSSFSRRFEIGDVSGVVETKIEELPIEEISNIEEPKNVTAQDLGFVVSNKPSFPKLPKLPKLPKFNFSLGAKPLILGSSLILVTLVISFILWWFLPKLLSQFIFCPKNLRKTSLLI